ncbi:unnamed protein product [Eruca vesicaria subsp. sativa]|uniref:Phorbol-ester/DAG-type domain-containing protein n=1 Tax=Eruca vesicaria subsp. sativa TaxID=29727 RepID=A0ABC8LSR8_ERUVS|nr:unnamed protein product [Eruca vesicaria subsp. sativa]
MAHKEYIITSSRSNYVSNQTSLLNSLTYIDQQMDTITSTTVYKPSFHDHPLFPSARFVNTYCGGCHEKETIYGGYYCNELKCPYWFFHKKCAEAPLEINHPSHPQHPLQLTSKAQDGLCNLCESYNFPPFYSCSTCLFKVDLICGMKLLPSAIEHPLCHDHPLAFFKSRKDIPCEACSEDIWGPSYLCYECNLNFHHDCVYLSGEVNHPCHSKHPIKLNATKNLIDDAQKICFSCKKQQKKVIYHCSICNFSICLVCTRNPPPLVIEKTKTHIHPLTLFSKKMPFTCDVCGEDGKGGPYVCSQCAFLSHGECIDLPHIININRHDHCISFTPHLGARYSECGICRKSLSQYHGAYYCSVCPKYAAHFRCAVRDGVWDLVDLEGIPNHDTEYIAPFKVVDDDLIIHFSHIEHPLKLYIYYILYDKWLQCEACLHPIGFESIYGCQECGFVLHEKCANLPMKKRIIFQPLQCSLEVVYITVESCMQCGELFDGFKYRVQGTWKIDVHCGSLSEPFVYDGHSHPLYFYERSEYSNCNVCENFIKGYILHCDACNFDLCCYCASLPLKIWHMNDDHPITLYHGVKESIKSWCDICESELDKCKWFYTCSDCQVTFHTRCVLGDFSRLKPEKLIVYLWKAFEVVRNNNNTRPLCSQCHTRCKVSIVLRAYDEDNGYICSRYCLSSYMG